MSIQEEIERISNNISSAYDAVQKKGGKLPEQRNSANLAEAIQGIRGMAGPDGNPIGTVISYIGTTPPKDYLVCDGSAHNVHEYPDLANFFEEEFGSKYHFGGNNDELFCVPDLREEISFGPVNMAVLSCIKATEAKPYEDIYSAEETVIGQWIDGRPIYRKVVELTITTVDKWMSYDVGIETPFSVISYYGYSRTLINDAQSIRIFPDPYMQLLTVKGRPKLLDLLMKSNFTIGTLLLVLNYVKDDVSNVSSTPAIPSAQEVVTPTFSEAPGSRAKSFESIGSTT